MKKNNKGMVASQIFTYMLGLIVISTTILIGFKVIGSFGNIQPKINDFKQDIEVLVNDISNEYGSFKRDRIPLTSKIKAVCFSNSNLDDDTDERIPLTDKNDLTKYEEILPPKAYASIYDSIESAVEANVFIVTTSNLEDAFYVDKLKVDDADANSIICLANRNGINFAMKGKGDHVVLYGTCENNEDCLSGECDTTNEKNVCIYS